jgi:serine/threonine protein kinase
LSLKSGAAIICKKGSYRIASESFGGGGMGNIYFAVSETGDKVVVKNPKFSGDSKDPIMLQKLKIEAKILSSLHHENIVGYIDERDDGDQNFFLVIEYLDGRNLLDQYRERPADEQTTREYAETILGILEYLHGDPNIIHRDINPKNIMTDSNKRLVLIDFGAAKQGYIQLLANPEEGGSYTLIGTQGYSAPEQFTTGEAIPASDIYGVGATLFYLLTSKKPSRYMQSGGGLTRSPRDVHPSISKDISHIIMRAMSQEPKDRYQTAADMVGALNGMEPILGAPHIVFQGRKYVIEDSLEIGRAHDCYTSRCRRGGFLHRRNITPLDVMVNDDQCYLSKHHARVLKDRLGGYWVEDLESRNCTAISHNGGKSFNILKPRNKEQLKDGDIVATVYNSKKGAYMTFMFRGE